MRPITLFVDSGVNKKITGLSAYSTNLARELIKYAPNNQIRARSRIPLLLSKGVNRIINVDFESVFSAMPFYLSLHRTGLNHLTSQEQAFCLNYLRRKTVVTVHDVIPLVTNEFNSVLAKKWYTLVLRGVSKANALITVSQHTKNDVVRLLNYPAENIHVVYEGVDHDYFKVAGTRRAENTILYVGSEMPRKNVMTLFRAFSEVREQIPEARLVKVGLAQWGGVREKLVHFVKEHRLEKSVIFKNYVENVAQEYQQASFFVFPSKYEGFGFPPLEAMACGCPVLCSNATSLPEVVGDAGVLFDPDNYKELAEKMVRLLKSETLRAHLAKKGVERARQFTWEKCAEETVAVYGTMYEGMHG